ncbi:MAG: hypothetical protein NTW34_05160, partial [Actinobacteria bacterium]|nr:hypothetical protein [Actinomycetota bacterium]
MLSPFGRFKAALLMFFLVVGCVNIVACSSDDQVGEGSSAPYPTSSCPTRTAVTGRPLMIVATVAPITSLVANIAAGSGTVIQGIVPEGTNSHT